MADLRVTPSYDLQRVTDRGNTTTNDILFSGGGIGLTTDSNNDLLIVPNGTGITQIGNAGSTSNTLNTNDDLFVSGRLEVDGWLYADGRVVVNKTGAGTYFFGQINGDDYWKMGGTPDDGTFIAVNSINGQGNNHIVFMDSANTGDDYGHTPAALHPTMIFHSSTAAAVATDEWISFGHDGTDGIINMGAGSLRMNAGIIMKRTATAIDYTTVEGDYIIGVTDTSVVRTITLASVTVKDGKTFIIKDESGAAGTNNIIIDTEGAETIDGQAQIPITFNRGVLRVYCNGTNWESF